MDTSKSAEDQARDMIDLAKSAFDGGSAELTTFENAEENYESIYLGQVYSFSPSGKYYTPWAHSDVTEEEAERDKDFWEIVQEKMETSGWWMEESAGDPTNLLVCRSVE